MEVQPNQPSENVMADGKGNVPGISATLQESKEHLSALKSQVAFAHQCLSLLQNQLNHAADTLGILQDQLVKAQDTLDHVVVPCGIHQPGITKRCHIHQHQHHCGAKSMEPLIGGVAEVPKSKGPQQSNENIPEGRAGHVPCGRDTQPSAGPSHHSLCDYPSAVRQLAVTPLKHGPGTVRSTGSTCKLSPELHRVPQPTPVSSSGSDPVKPMGPPPGELSVKVEPTTERDSSTEGVTEQCTSFAPSKPAKLQSSSPMAHQLLQVIDVLQSADEEKGGVQGDAATIQPTPPMGGAPVASHYESLADPLLRTMPPGASMHSRQRASPRKGRKPGWPLKLPAASGRVQAHAGPAFSLPQPVIETGASERRGRAGNGKAYLSSFLSLPGAATLSQLLVVEEKRQGLRAVLVKCKTATELERFPNSKYSSSTPSPSPSRPPPPTPLFCLSCLCLVLP